MTGGIGLTVSPKKLKTRLTMGRIPGGMSENLRQMPPFRRNSAPEVEKSKCFRADTQHC